MKGITPALVVFLLFVAWGFVRYRHAFFAFYDDGLMANGILEAYRETSNGRFVEGLLLSTFTPVVRPGYYLLGQAILALPLPLAPLWKLCLIPYFSYLFILAAAYRVGILVSPRAGLYFFIPILTVLGGILFAAPFSRRRAALLAVAGSRNLEAFVSAEKPRWILFHEASLSALGRHAADYETVYAGRASLSERNPLHHVTNPYPAEEDLTREALIVRRKLRRLGLVVHQF